MQPIQQYNNTTLRTNTTATSFAFYKAFTASKTVFPISAGD